jgi:hypothetical protein
MMTLLAHIYGQPYSYAEGDDPLQKLALLFVAAEKYQLLSGPQGSRLHGKLFNGLESKIQSQNFDLDDFYNAVRIIFTSAGLNPNVSNVRAPMISGCVSYLEELRQDPEFVTLLKDFPDLSIAILTSHELACAFPGDWGCESGLIEEYFLCDGVPVCPHKITKIGKEPSACGYRFTKLYAWRHSNVINWRCQSCGNLSRPICSGCQRYGAWGRRCFERLGLY